MKWREMQNINENRCEPSVHTNDMANRNMLMNALKTAHAVCYLPSHCFRSHKKLQYTLLKTSHLNKTYIKCAKKRIILQYPFYSDGSFICFILCVYVASRLARNFCVFMYVGVLKSILSVDVLFHLQSRRHKAIELSEF